jgi:hypothetical protein
MTKGIELLSREALMAMRYGRHALVACLVILLTTLSPLQLQSKIYEPPSMADEQWLAQKSIVIFRGKVLMVEPDPHPVVRHWGTVGGVEQSYDFRARFRVDRVYRGKVGETMDVPFTTLGLMRPPYCDTLETQRTFVVFLADLAAGGLTLTDDCWGALPVSARLGLVVAAADWSEQMEADFVAGLDDPDPDARIWSLQRLGGLKLASSRRAIHREIEQTSGEERKWAVYAALRTGDESVLPQVRDYLSASIERGGPEWEMAGELRDVANPDAIADLLKIAQGAISPMARDEALVAFLWHFNDPQTVPAFAANLGAEDRDLRSTALEGMVKFARTSECTYPDTPQNNSTPESRAAYEKDFEQHVRLCRDWWEKAGMKQDWTHQ